MRLASGTRVPLPALAEEICGRYRAEFPDEADRYGDAGHAWCVHDNSYLLAWAITDVDSGGVDFFEQLDWLSRVLAARDFPLERLARNLELAAEVIQGESLPQGPAVAERLLAGAVRVLATA